MSDFRILVVEDEPLIAEDISDFLESAGFQVPLICYDAQEALDFVAEEKVDAYLLDIDLGEGMDGVQLAEELNQHHPRPVVFLTSHSDRSTLERVTAVKASGYLVKPFREAELFTAIELALINYAPKTELSIDDVNKVLPTALSDREFEMLLKLKEGKTNKEIADELCVSINTVKSHLQHVYEKLDARNRTEALFRISNLFIS